MTTPSAPPVQILETTLRDGSYEIDFQFTADDTAFFVGALDRAGFSYIELCHGNGVGVANWEARLRPGVQPQASDEEHLEAARSMSPRALLGVLLVAGGKEYTPPSIIDLVARYGVKFVRIGLTPETFADRAYWLEYIARIKHHGMIASINLMQTAAVAVRAVAEGAAVAAQHDCDWFYVVDSFGGMMPPGVQEYIRAIGDASGLRTGLHAHNNLGLAVANSLAAIAAGATLVDSTLQGIGRATGNAQTEILTLALQQMGHERGLDTDGIMSLGDLARVYFADKGNDPTYFVSGAAGIHSRAIPGLLKTAAVHGRAPRELILRVGAEANRLGYTVRDMFAEDLVRDVVEKTPHVGARAPTPPLLARFEAALRRDADASLAVHAELVFSCGVKARKVSALHLVDAEQFLYGSALSWESRDVLGITAPISRGASASLGDRSPDVVILDPAVAGWPGLPKGRAHTLVLPFATVVAEATAALAALRPGAHVWLHDGAGLDSIRAALVSRGVAVAASEPNGAERLIVTGGDAALLPKLRRGDHVVTLQRGAARAVFVDAARAAGAIVLLPPIGAQLAGWTVAQVAIARATAAAQLKPANLGAAHVVPPVLAAGSGELVVDSTSAPARIVDRSAVDGALPLDALAAARATAFLNGKT